MENSVWAWLKAWSKIALLCVGVVQSKSMSTKSTLVEGPTRTSFCLSTLFSFSVNFEASKIYSLLSSKFRLGSVIGDSSRFVAVSKIAASTSHSYSSKLVKSGFLRTSSSPYGRRVAGQSVSVLVGSTVSLTRA